MDRLIDWGVVERCVERICRSYDRRTTVRYLENARTHIHNTLVDQWLVNQQDIEGQNTTSTKSTMNATAPERLHARKDD